MEDVNDEKWRNATPIGSGLDNLTNSCFLNSVLQVLMHTSPFYNNLMCKLENSHQCQSGKFCLLCSLKELLLETRSGTGSVPPTKIFVYLQQICLNLVPGRQEDAHEFLRGILLYLHEEWLGQNNNDVSINETGPIYRIFGGYYRSQQKCLTCNSVSNKYDAFLDIALEVRNCDNIQQALRFHCKTEVLNGDNKLNCTVCENKVDASKSISLDQPPLVLTLMLKRFQFQYGVECQKISTHIKFTQTLNLQSHCSNNEEPCLYNLYGVIVHHGKSQHSGHYVAFVKSSNGEWYEMNDSSVHQVSINNVLNQQAYMLFYTKVNSLQGLQSEQMVTLLNDMLFYKNNMMLPTFSNATAEGLFNNGEIISDLLSQHFGFNNLKPFQKAVINAILSGRDVCAVIATGAGKSLCYQLPPLITNKTTVVISPLISLMQDQVLSLHHHNITACYLGSAQKDKNIEQQAFQGVFPIVFMTPEKCVSNIYRIRDCYNKNLINLIAVDEAHCVAEWGHDFRPAFRKLSIIRKILPDIPILALTATATTDVQDDIISNLQLHEDLFRFVGSFDRKNLHYSIRAKTTMQQDMDEIFALASIESNTIIIYCLTIELVDSVTAYLKSKDIKAGAYHGKKSDKIRTKNHNDFLNNKIRVIVATTAFGMGIDKRDVRYVIHYGAPQTVESYYQQTGRAGRDGKPSRCILYYKSKDFSTNSYLIQMNHKHYLRRDANLNLLQYMKNYCYGLQCRRRFLLAYFDEALIACTGCDYCDGASHDEYLYDIGKELYLLLRAIRDSGNRFGLGIVVKILRGSNAREVTQDHKKLEVYGKGKFRSDVWWKSFGQFLCTKNYINTVIINGFFRYETAFKGNKFLSNNTHASLEGPFPEFSGKLPHYLTIQTLRKVNDEAIVLDEFEDIGQSKEINTTPKLSVLIDYKHVKRKN